MFSFIYPSTQMYSFQQPYTQVKPSFDFSNWYSQPGQLFLPQSVISRSGQSAQYPYQYPQTPIVQQVSELRKSYYIQPQGVENIQVSNIRSPLKNSLSRVPTWKSVRESEIDYQKNKQYLNKTLIIKPEFYATNQKSTDQQQLQETPQNVQMKQCKGISVPAQVRKQPQAQQSSIKKPVKALTKNNSQKTKLKYHPGTQNSMNLQTQLIYQINKSQPSNHSNNDSIKSSENQRRISEAITSPRKVYGYEKSPVIQKKKQETPTRPILVNRQQQLEDLALQYEDGFIYRGKGYPPSIRHGFGILSDENDNVIYEGQWKQNTYEGKGRLNNILQEVVEKPIDWNNMSSIKNGWANYEGFFKQGKMHGYGYLILTNTEKYVGEFFEGMIEGQGEFTTLDGDSIKGYWQSGILVQKN